MFTGGGNTDTGEKVCEMECQKGKKDKGTTTLLHPIQINQQSEASGLHHTAGIKMRRYFFVVGWLVILLLIPLQEDFAHLSINPDRWVDSL